MSFEKIKSNLKSGITVSLISIPLSVSLAVASNVSPLIGIITAIWAGLVAGILGGSNYNIVGPTGALSGLIASYIILNGIGGLPVLTILVGIFILAAYIFRLERYLILIPSSVIHGFTLGVAFIIGLNQLNSAFGLQGLPTHETFFANVLESLRHLTEVSTTSIIVFSVFFICLLLFKKMTPKMPGAIVLAPIGIVLGYLSTTHVLPITLQTLGRRFGQITFQLFAQHSWQFSTSMLQTASVIALIAILETMLSAKIADGMTRTKHNERKEMLGLGLANIVSGLVGGMPATAALARTSLNIKTGANSNYSAVINALSVCLISAFLLGYFTYLPMPVIAAILVFVAVQMVEAEHFMKLWHYERSGFFVSILVALITIIEDPIVGILFGVAVSLLLFVNRISHGHFDLRVNRFDEGIVDTVSGEKITVLEDADVLLYSIKGKLCYINSRAHVTRFEAEFNKYKHIIVRLREVYFMDTDGIEALDEIIDLCESRGQEIILTSIDPTVQDLLEQLSTGYHRLKDKKLIFEKSIHAVKYVGLPTKTPKKDANPPK